MMKSLCVLQSMCSEADLKDLGLPMGPRKKLLLMLQEEKGKKVRKGMDDSRFIRLRPVLVEWMNDYIYGMYKTSIQNLACFLLLFFFFSLTYLDQFVLHFCCTVLAYLAGSVCVALLLACSFGYLCVTSPPPCPPPPPPPPILSHFICLDLFGHTHY